MAFSFPQQFDDRHETHAGFSAMHLATFRNHAEMVKMLLLSRVNPDAQVSVCLSVGIYGHSKMLTKQCRRLMVSRRFTSRACTAALP